MSSTSINTLINGNSAIYELSDMEYILLDVYHWLGFDGILCVVIMTLYANVVCAY